MPRKLVTFSDKYLANCKDLSIEEKVDFLENYRLAMSDTKAPLMPINFDIPKPLLEAFKQKSKLEGIAYQTQIKKLMKQWLA